MERENEDMIQSKDDSIIVLDDSRSIDIVSIEPNILSIGSRERVKEEHSIRRGDASMVSIDPKAI
jgi:hypothetical protein